jgi:hypothetical protein
LLNAKSSARIKDTIRVVCGGQLPVGYQAIDVQHVNVGTAWAKGAVAKRYSASDQQDAPRVTTFFRLAPWLQIGSVQAGEAPVTWHSEGTNSKSRFDAPAKHKSEMESL